MRITLNILVLFTIIGAFVACEKKADWVAEQTFMDNSKAYIKIVHAAPYFRKIHEMQDTFNIMVNNQKINSGAITYNGMWPFSVNSTTNSITATYAAVTPGPNEIRLVVPGVNTPDSATIFAITKELGVGRTYTFVLTDSMEVERDSSRIFVEDPLDGIAPLPGYFNLRLIHAVMNDTAGTTIKISSYARNGDIFTNVKPGTTTAYARLNFNPGVVDTFYVRRYVQGAPANTGQILAKIAFNAALAGGGSMDQRSYTLYYKGDADLTSGTKARSLAAYINK